MKYNTLLETTVSPLVSLILYYLSTNFLWKIKLGSEPKVMIIVQIKIVHLHINKKIRREGKKEIRGKIGGGKEMWLQKLYL